jgi:hypothetical protein
MQDSTGIRFAAGQGGGSDKLHNDRPLDEALGLDGGSKVLVFSTEADTDPVMYRRVVWGGR